MPVDMNKLVSLDRLKEMKTAENAMMAATYSTSKTYAVGDYVYYNGTLYKCTTAITTAEAWTSGHWTAAKLADDTSALLTATTEYEEYAIGKTNLLNGVSWTDGYYISASGVITSSSSNRYSSLIPISKGTYKLIYDEKVASATTRIHQYGLNDAWEKQLISSAPTTTGILSDTIIIEADTKIRISTGIPTRTELIVLIKNTSVENKLNDLSDKINDINTNAGNLHEYEQELTKTSNKYIATDGSIATVSNSGYKVTQYIDVEGYDKVIYSASASTGNLMLAFYDTNQAFISGLHGVGAAVSDKTEDVPYNAKYVVLAQDGNGTSSCTLAKWEYDLKWVGKKWAVIGDSLTASTSRTTKNYHTYIAEKTGITVVNMGVSGTGYRNDGGVSKAFYQVVSDVPTDADVVTIFGGFNDGFTDLGTASDTGTTTVGGCMNTTLDNLYAVMPTVQLGIIAPTPWKGSNPYNGTAANAYIELLEDVCKRRSIPFLNLYYESNLRPWDSTFRELAYSKDDDNGVHPDETGHAIIAPRFEGFLDSLLLS